MNEHWRLRPASNFDSAEVTCLIDRVFREYGDRVAPRRGEIDLADIEKNYWRADGAFVVLEESNHWANAGEIIGSAAMLPAVTPRVCTLKRFYLDARYRGKPAAVVLARWAIAWAHLRGFQRLEFWSDTRFERGHAFFRKIGLEKKPQTREVRDGVYPYREVFIQGQVGLVRERLAELDVQG